MVDVRNDIPELFASTLERLARSGTILVDQRPNPSLPRATIPALKQWEITRPDTKDREEDESESENEYDISVNNHHFYLGHQNLDDLDLDTDTNHDLNQDLEVEKFQPLSQSQSQERSSDEEANPSSDLHKRNIATITSTATIIPPKSIMTSTVTASSSSSTLASSETSSGLWSAATGNAGALPAPFDSGFTSNITASCSSFMMGFLANESFKACLPFSLLLQNSNSFFQASKSHFRITQTLDATCSANPTTCSTLMTTLANNLTSPTTCSLDLLAHNPLITQARLGLLAYSTLYTASCLKDPSTSAYCYAQAVTNSSSPTDSYIYYLPLNVSLPVGTQPTCNTCLKNTMTIFQQAAGVRTSALARVYPEAASVLDAQCGPGFVNASLPTAVLVQSGVGGVRPGGEMGGLPWAGLLVLWMAVWRWLV
ncbi:hypothetical protein NHQ30_005740 [Ciborinia camelliae]|nr:hypothetical protein NHQ30_005740 [Ciborinia camelliae]